MKIFKGSCLWFCLYCSSFHILLRLGRMNDYIKINLFAHDFKQNDCFHALNQHPEVQRSREFNCSLHPRGCGRKSVQKIQALYPVGGASEAETRINGFLFRPFIDHTLCVCVRETSHVSHRTQMKFSRFLAESCACGKQRTPAHKGF